MITNKPIKGEIWAFDGEKYLILENVENSYGAVNIYPLQSKNGKIVRYEKYHFNNLRWVKIC